jgi:hypothetical protein
VTPFATENESTPTTQITETTTAPMPTATPADDRAVGKCRNAIAAAAAAFLQADAKAVGTCKDRIVAGKLPRDTECRTEIKTAAAVAKARRKLATTISKACAGKAKTCGAGDDDVALADAGWSVAACPGVPGGGCRDAIVDCGDVAACLGCIADAGADRLAALSYGALVPTSPKSKAEKRLNQSQATIGRAVTALVVANTKATAASAASAAIMQAELRAEAAICKACGGPDRACGGDDDFGPSTIGFVATCPAARSPRTGASCAGTIATLGDVAACVECLTAVEVECAARAATPGVAADAGDCGAVIP